MKERTEKTLKEASLVFPIEGDVVWLGLKPISESGEIKIGEGKRNGYGGGIENGETILECAKRELEEESGLVVEVGDFEKRAELTFYKHKSTGEISRALVHVFVVRLSGIADMIRATPEMGDPQSFPVHHLPNESLMRADRDWLPLVLAGKKIRATAHYTPQQKELIGEVEIEFVESFES